MKIVREVINLDKIDLDENVSILIPDELLRTLASSLSLHVNESYQRAVSRKNNKDNKKLKINNST